MSGLIPFAIAGITADVLDLAVFKRLAGTFPDRDALYACLSTVLALACCTSLTAGLNSFLYGVANDPNIQARCY
jgi:hypothetical protein